MSESNLVNFKSIEMLIVALVLFSTLSIGFQVTEESVEITQIDGVKGTLELNTRSAMDSLGLVDFYPGASVEIDIDVFPVIANDCDICVESPTGLILTGEVNVSQLRPIDSGGQVRVEGKLNVTHLQEFNQQEFIVREWLTIDWDLDEFSTQWDIFIQHTPPKWSPSNRYDASLVQSGSETKSRVGPVIFVEELIGDAMNIRGCLPNSLNCDGINREEMNLTSTMAKPKPVEQIEINSKWMEYTPLENNQSNTSMLTSVRNLFELVNSTNSHNSHCLSESGTPQEMQSWLVSSDSSSSVSPMGLWLSSIGLPTTTVSLSNGIWTETDFGNSGCGSLTNDGKLLLGVSKS